MCDPTAGRSGGTVTCVTCADSCGPDGAVFQDYMAYDLSAAENIALGDLDRQPGWPRIEQAARRAGIHHQLVSLPHGYDTR